MRLQAQRERRLSQKCITILDVRLAWKLFACIVEKPRKQRYTKRKYVQSIQRIKTPGAGREGNGMGKIKILLVDDEREEREGISWLIEKYEYPLEIMQASNGKEALQCIEKTKIDIYTRFKTSTYYLMSIALSTFLTLLYILISHQWNAQAFSLVLLILFIFLVELSWIIFRFQSKQFCYTDSLNMLVRYPQEILRSLSEQLRKCL